MEHDQKNSLSRSRWSVRTGHAIDLICLFVLIAVVGTVIYGFALRAIWAHGYYVAVAAALIGAVAMLVGLAQQVIAARDFATWHDMAVWQLRAAHMKVQLESPTRDPTNVLPISTDSADYYASLIQVYIESMQTIDGGLSENE